MTRYLSKGKVVYTAIGKDLDGGYDLKPKCSVADMKKARRDVFVLDDSGPGVAAFTLSQRLSCLQNV